jgi:RNA recognition motif-containing protein
LKTRHHTVKGKQCEVKRAVSRENKKIFVGGVSGDMSEAEIRAYFSRYGEVGCHCLDRQ